MTYKKNLDEIDELKMNIQLFADEGDDSGQKEDSADDTSIEESDSLDQTEGVNDGNDGNDEQDDTLTLSPSELQSKIDSAITKALKTQKKNLEKEQQKKQREKQLKEENKWKELYEQKEQELEEKRNDFVRKQLEAEVATALSNRKLENSFAGFVPFDIEDSAEEVQARVDDLAKLVENYANRKIEDLRNSDPRGFKNPTFGKTNQSKADESRRKEVSQHLKRLYPETKNDIFN